MAQADDTPAFRRATALDVAAVTSLVESAYRGEASRAGWTTEADLLDGQRTDARAVEQAVEHPDGMVLLAEVDDTLAGSCQLKAGGTGWCHFGMFAIRPDRQGKGIGDALLQEAERVAGAEWGSQWLQMEVIALRSELIAWYHRRGYHDTGRTLPFPYGDPRFGLPRRDDLVFVVLEKALDG